MIHEELNPLRSFAGGAIGLNRTFSGLQQQLFKTKLLAMNAEIACSRLGEAGVAFGVVARDLIGVGATLRAEVGELEGQFHEIACSVGALIRSRHRFRSYLAVVEAVHQQEAADGLGKGLTEMPPLAPDFADRHDSDASARENVPLLQHAWNGASGCREDIFNTISSVSECCQNLTAFLQRLNFIATRQSGFLATTARVEAAHVDDKEVDLGAVADDIHGLARDFSTLQGKAEDAVQDFIGEAERLLQKVQSLRSKR